MEVYAKSVGGTGYLPYRICGKAIVKEFSNSIACGQCDTIYNYTRYQCEECGTQYLKITSSGCSHFKAGWHAGSPGANMTCNNSVKPKCSECQGLKDQLYFPCNHEQNKSHYYCIEHNWIGLTNKH